MSQADERGRSCDVRVGERIGTRCRDHRASLTRCILSADTLRSISNCCSDECWGRFGQRAH